MLSIKICRREGSVVSKIDPTWVIDAFHNSSFEKGSAMGKIEPHKD
jgi:hypothetical protein